MLDFVDTDVVVGGIALSQVITDVERCLRGRCGWSNRRCLGGRCHVQTAQQFPGAYGQLVRLATVWEWEIPFGVCIPEVFVVLC